MQSDYISGIEFKLYHESNLDFRRKISYKCSMTALESGKLKRLLETMLPQSVVTSAMLSELGISNGLARDYAKNGWLVRIGVGAFRRAHEQVTWPAGLHALQSQLHSPLTLGAMSALAADGSAHYLRLARETVFLFSAPNVSLPAWFKNHDWNANISHTQTKLLPPDLGIRDQTLGGFTLKASSPERAILECLHLAPATIDLDECYQVLSGLLNLRPALMQSLLETCNSIKVKRLFLFMADKANLPVMKHLDQNAIDLGSGNRSIVRDGAYVSRYRLMLPKGLVGNG
jgi:Transcriptional regulator, AbiEi antitoxin, Type IV TA system/Transcriptional regulator, AbiEi antitoxin N-terminal domain